jgi:hypothetical protein
VTTGGGGRYLRWIARSGPGAEDPVMVKRIGIGALWFFTVNSGWSLVMLASDLPRLPGLMLAAFIAVAVITDPRGLISPRPAENRTAREMR